MKQATPAQPAPTRTSTRSHRRHGGVYLAVLGASMIVTILGVTGLYAVRLQGRISVGANDAMRAVAMVQSATDYARLQLKNDAGWRSRYTNNVWVTDIPFNGGRLSFKLVDELDGNLSNDSSHAIRLHARAAVGKAVRIQSLQLIPLTSGQLLPVTGSWRQEVLP